VKRLRVVPPFLVASFPILFLYHQNLRIVPFRQVAPPLLITLAITAVLMLALRWLVRDADRAGAVVSLALLLFFSYGQFHTLLEARLGTEARIGAAKLLVPLWTLLFAAGTWAALRTRRSLRPLTAGLNFVAGALVLLTVVQLAAAALQRRVVPPLPAAEEEATASVPADELPNIFYVIFDGYGRADVLRELYGHDNGPFLDWLRAKGFFVADQGRSNYGQTTLSLSSALNMNYLDRLVAAVGPDYADLGAMTEWISQSRVLHFLRARGYRIVSLASDYEPIAPASADVVLRPGVSVSQFQTILIRCTALRLVIPVLRALRPRTAFLPHALHRARVHYTIEKLVELQDAKGPLFVFAHVYPPHPPFVFGPDGEEVTPPWPYSHADASHWFEKPGAKREDYIRGYRNQVCFANQRIRTLIEGLLANASRPTVIVLQGDHGPGSRMDFESADRTDMHERLSIFNAIYLPGGAEKLYPTLTPVNTFRILLNHVFGTKFPLLPDRSFFSTWSRPLAFQDVTDRACAGSDDPQESAPPKDSP